MARYFLALAALLPACAYAQAGVERRTDGAGDKPLPVPDYRSAPGKIFEDDGTLAPSPTPGRAATAAQFVIKRVDLHGAAVLPAAQLSAVTDRYLNRAITADELLEMRDAITRVYVDAGYLNSGAVIPDQDISDGVVDVDVVEGRLVKVEVRGLKHLRADYISSRVRADGVLNRLDLQSSFERLSADANVAKINARLGPGARPGEAILSLDVEEARRWTGEVEGASDRSPSIGGERAVFRSAFRDGFGIGDRTSIEVGKTEGLRDVAASFSAPLNAHDLALTLEATGSHAKVVEKPLNELDVISDSYTGRATLTEPLWRRAGQNLTAGLGISYTNARTELLGGAFSFSPGAVDGKTHQTVARATMDYVSQAPSQVLALRSTLSYGLEATKQPDGAAVRMDPHFFSLALQSQYARATTRSGQQALIRLDVQLAAQSLFALEQSSFGGIDSVRGYRKNQVLADNAVVGSLEYRAPLRDLMAWRRNSVSGEAAWFGAVFADGGYGWNTDLPNPAVRSIASVGASLTWRPTQRLSAQFYAAKRLQNDSAPMDKRLQDYGVGFRVTQRLW